MTDSELGSALVDKLKRAKSDLLAADRRLRKYQEHLYNLRDVLRNANHLDGRLWVDERPVDPWPTLDEYAHALSEQERLQDHVRDLQKGISERFGIDRDLLS